MKLNDEVIAHLAQILQLALLSGTDIVDHMRMINLEESDGELFLNEDYVNNHKENIQNMLNEALEKINEEGS